MKNLLLIVTCLGSGLTFAQKLSKTELQEAIANETCACVAGQEVTRENYEMTLGFCILEGINNHEKDVERHYGKDLITDSERMEELGRDVGFKMAAECPEAFSILMDEENEETNDSYDGYEDNTEYLDDYSGEVALGARGKVIEIKNEGFLKLRIREESGKISEFIILEPFDDSYMVTDRVLVLGDVIVVYYSESELYDAGLNKFITYNVVGDIDKE